jgi:hypothetical protein
MRCGLVGERRDHEGLSVVGLGRSATAARIAPARPGSPFGAGRSVPPCVQSSRAAGSRVSRLAPVARGQHPSALIGMLVDLRCEVYRSREVPAVGQLLRAGAPISQRHRFREPVTAGLGQSVRYRRMLGRGECVSRESRCGRTYRRQRDMPCVTSVRQGRPRCPMPGGTTGLMSVLRVSARRP